MPSTLGTQSQVPSIRPFQMDPGGLGSIADAVNLFRGEITLPLTLVSLTGRGGLNASATLVYNSNVARQADLWNLDAPTGPLGLGWSFAFEFIAFDDRRSPGQPEGGDYYLVSGGATNLLYRTGQTGDAWTFELASYQFWDIRYYPASEQWVIVKEDGNRWTYGGTSSEAVQYGVRWNGSEANWTDATVETNGQQQYAVAWNLAKVETPWDDLLAFAYENENLTIGGTGGLTYTRSSRLVRVTDPTGQTLDFSYDKKYFNEEIREYQIPHVDPDSPDFIAYQDRLETHYLSAIEVHQSPAAGGALLSRIDFGYEVVNASASPGDPDLFKRYLTSATIHTSDGLALPPLNFSYYNRPEDRDAGRLVGGLRQILYPQGAAVTYDYARTELSGTDHDIELSPLGTPRVFFGADYTVVAYYNASSRGLEVRVYSWNGKWVEDPASYTFPVEIDLETLQVSPQADFFALSFHTDESGSRLFTILFHKTEGQFGRWTIEDGFTALPIGPGGDQGLVVTGNGFAAAITSGASSMVKVWDQPSRTWIDRTNSVHFNSNVQYSVAARDEVLLIAEWSSSSETVDLSLYWLDTVTGDFSQGSLQTARINGVKWQDSTGSLFWSMSANFASMTYVTRIGEDDIDYTVAVLQWNALRQGVIATSLNTTVPASSKLPFLQSQASGSVIGNIVNVLRYDGTDWTSGTLASTNGIGSDASFAYGSDAAVVCSSSIAAASRFDPYALAWKNENPGSAPSTIAPSISGDFLTIGRDVYYRDASGALNRIGSLDPNMDEKSLTNRAPLFIAWQDQSGNAHVLPVRNGTLLTAGELVLPNEKIVAGVSGPGTSLVGGSVLLTYTGSDLDNASSLTLRQYINEQLDGAVVVWPITELSIDDGYDDSWTSGGASRAKQTLYFYDCENVTVTPDASVTEFAAATAIYGVVSGTGGGGCYPAPAETQFGSTEYRYHNNRTPVSNGFVLSARAAEAESGDYSYIVGMLYDRTDRDAEGIDVSRQVNRYLVEKRRELLDGSGTRVALYGAYVKLASVEDTFYETVLAPDLAAIGGVLVERHARAWAHFPDPESHVRYPVVRNSAGEVVTAVAVIRRVDYGYSPSSGLPVLEETTNVDSSGKEVALQTLTSYAYDVGDYTGMRDAHILTNVAATVRVAAGAAYELSVTTYKLWSSGTAKWAVCRTYAGRSASLFDPSATPPVDFSDWNNVAPPADADWRRTSEVLARLAEGPVTEALDVERRPVSTHFDKTASFQCATFQNGSAAETAFAGFEDYERLDGWRLASGQPVASLVIRGDAHTGVAAIQLSPSTTEALQIDLTLESKRYLLSCWIKTSPSFRTAPGAAAWVLRAGGSDIGTYALDGTDGSWELRTFAVPVPPAGAVTLQAYNHKSGAGFELLLDDVFFTPLTGDASAMVYHPRYLDLSATLSFTGATTRSLLDSYRRPVADIGPDGSVTQVSSIYSTRMFHAATGNTELDYPADDPDSALSIAPAAFSPFANLVQGNGWKDEWRFDAQAAWNAADGTLVHTRQSATPETITWSTTDDFTDYGVRVSVQLQVQDGEPVLPSHPLAIRIGTRLSADWTPQNGWSVTLDGVTAHTPAGQPFQTDWLLIATTDPVTNTTVVFFFADGRKLFAQKAASAISGAVTLVAQDAGIGFHGIAAFREPRMNTTYRDGSAKERQKQVFTGSDCLVAATGYDPVGRAAIATKTARIDGHLFGYLTDFITSFDPVSGVMTGLVADAYPDDGGYPYARTDFYRSPMNLSRAQGLPGEDFAITEENAHVLTYEYGTNGTDSSLWPDTYPAGEYFAQKTTDPDGGEVWTLRTKRGEAVMTKAGPLADGTWQTSRNEYNAAGVVVKSYQPNHYAAGAAGDSFIVTLNYDFLGQLLSRTGPNAGTTQFIYDLAGRPRFRANTGVSGDVTIVYTKYDSMGRVVEDGTFVAAWDRAVLTAKAETDPEYPGSSQPHTVAHTLTYGDGTVATSIGRVVTSTSATADGGTVIQTFLYDANGLTSSIQTSVSDFDSTPRAIGYTYDNLGNVLTTRYPDGSAVPEVARAYDRAGQIAALGTSASAADFGTYSYNAVGALTAATLNPNSARPLSRSLTYNSPGWLLDTRASFGDGANVFGETLTYTSGGYGNAGYYSGRIASATYEAPDGYAYRYAFDRLGQLTVAENTVDPAASIGTTTPTGFDPDGNIETLEQGGEERTYGYTAGTDQVTTVTAGGATLASFTYAQGYAVSASRQELAAIEYDPVDALTTRVTKSDGNTLAFAYDTSNGRVLKLERDAAGAEVAAKACVRGTDLMPLSETARAGGQTQTTQFIYGPDGLQALQLGASRYTVIRDHLGSARVVVDETGNVVASFDYLPFGTLIRRGGSNPDVLLYRFTGQELDPETGLYNLNARLYDPWLGRFYALDPAGQGFSPYVYVDNDPTNLTDPTGEAAFLAFLLIVAIGAIIGAVAGAVTYALTYQGNFDVGKFFLYAAVGFVSGAVGAAAGYGAGVLATTALVAAGVTTTSSIASGVVVGATTGLVEGAVAGGLNQIGINVIEGRNPWEGVGQQIGIGGAIGLVTGGVAGGITGKLNRPVARQLAQDPAQVAGPNVAGTGDLVYIRNLPDAADFMDDIAGALNAAGPNDVTAIVGHGSRTSGRAITSSTAPPFYFVTRATDVVNAGAAYGGYGIDMSMVCWAGRNGFAQQVASGLGVPVRASTGPTISNILTQTVRPAAGHRFVTIYPSRLKTAWVTLFGY